MIIQMSMKVRDMKKKKKKKKTMMMMMMTLSIWHIPKKGIG